MWLFTLEVLWSLGTLVTDIPGLILFALIPLGIIIFFFTALFEGDNWVEFGIYSFMSTLCLGLVILVAMVSYNDRAIHIRKDLLAQFVDAQGCKPLRRGFNDTMVYRCEYIPDAECVVSLEYHGDDTLMETPSAIKCGSDFPYQDLDYQSRSLVDTEFTRWAYQVHLHYGSLL
jgi:hypothetical protein